MSDAQKPGCWDIAGLGKVAEAIPKEVYERSAETLLTTFEKLTAPITETTAGFGRYLRQKFDNMVESEKAIATYTLQKAVYRASERCNRKGIALHAPAHPKTFVKSLEEASKETDPVLHEMWANLLGSQMSENGGHPHFVEILSHFSPLDAKLLTSLFPRSEIGATGNFVGVFPTFGFRWIRKNSDTASEPWTIHSEMLFDFRLAHLAPAAPSNRNVSIPYLTDLGIMFLAEVSYEEAAAGPSCRSVPSDSEGVMLSTQGIQNLIRSTMHDVTGKVISIDTTPITGPTGQHLLIPFDPNQTAFSFLTQIYQALRDKVPSVSYGDVWVLEDTSTGAIYDAKSPTDRQNLISQTIGKFGFRAGMTLRTVRPPRKNV